MGNTSSQQNQDAPARGQHGTVRPFGAPPVELHSALLQTVSTLTTAKIEALKNMSDGADFITQEFDDVGRARNIERYLLMLYKFTRAIQFDMPLKGSIEDAEGLIEDAEAGERDEISGQIESEAKNKADLELEQIGIIANQLEKLEEVKTDIGLDQAQETELKRLYKLENDLLEKLFNLSCDNVVGTDQGDDKVDVCALAVFLDGLLTPKALENRTLARELCDLFHQVEAKIKKPDEPLEKIKDERDEAYSERNLKLTKLATLLKGVITKRIETAKDKPIDGREAIDKALLALAEMPENGNDEIDKKNEEKSKWALRYLNELGNQTNRNPNVDAWVAMIAINAGLKLVEFDLGWLAGVPYQNLILYSMSIPYANLWAKLTANTFWKKREEKLFAVLLSVAAAALAADVPPSPWRALLQILVFVGVSLLYGGMVICPPVRKLFDHWSYSKYEFLPSTFLMTAPFLIYLSVILNMPIAGVKAIIALWQKTPAPLVFSETDNWLMFGFVTAAVHLFGFLFYNMPKHGYAKRYGQRVSEQNMKLKVDCWSIFQLMNFSSNQSNFGRQAQNIDTILAAIIVMTLWKNLAAIFPGNSWIQLSGLLGPLLAGRLGDLFQVMTFMWTLPSKPGRSWYHRFFDLGENYQRVAVTGQTGKFSLPWYRKALALTITSVGLFLTGSQLVKQFAIQEKMDVQDKTVDKLLFDLIVQMGLFIMIRVLQHLISTQESLQTVCIEALGAVCKPFRAGEAFVVGDTEWVAPDSEAGQPGSDGEPKSRLQCAKKAFFERVYMPKLSVAENKIRK
ncbi:MAG: hypothetical protein HOK80_02530, partial [Candidatus Cloacimonetes bacterium]|nr:hypothetical protein [Candidatus Cloacimonadota bacterium]